METHSGMLASWLITGGLLLFMAWRSAVLGWFSEPSRAEDLHEHAVQGGRIPGYSLVLVSLCAGSWNILFAIEFYSNNPDATRAAMFSGAAQYALIAITYLVFPFIKGLQASGSNRGIARLVAGAFIVGHVFAPVYIVWVPSE